MVDWLQFYDKYYSDNKALYDLLLTHSRCVADKALDVLKRHPEIQADAVFVEEAAMLHDIGIFLTDAPPIHCFGKHPYIAHGYLGAELMRKEGLPLHALVCERHTGTGLSEEESVARNLPVPHIDMRPRSTEEVLICYADKFFSKTRPTEEKSPESVVRSLAKFGEEGILRFREWHKIFG